ncbi:flavin reductase family protein [Methanosarcinales archaeon]|nr:MAG: flavin reductase family protein [Methanosarcinales archaeon]
MNKRIYMVAVDDYYKLIAPRPVVCVSTVGKDGVHNIAPFSFCTPLSFSPPLLGVAVGKGKDTLRNMLESGDFVVVPVTREWAKQAIMTAEPLPYGKSEFELAGLTPIPSKVVMSPSVAEAPINIECTTQDSFETGDHVFVVGKVVHMECSEGALKKGRINIEELGTVGHITSGEFTISSEAVIIE